ncbi:MAG: hypothetical protein P1P86_05980 [Bacteroidales bacterium]|nr:hypothetical protein [Bacteroidales bacterium]
MKHLPYTVKEQEDGDPDNNIEERFKELRVQLIENAEFAEGISRVLKREILEEYRAVLKNRSNRRIKYFASLVAEAGRELGLEELELYGKELFEKTEAFNLKHINSLLDEFSGLYAAIQTNPFMTREEKK